MKNIVISDEYKETDLKPSDLLHTYIELTEKDIARYFINNGKLIDCACPGCHTVDIRSSFVKFGLRYVECPNCRTLYVSPRPDASSLADYYHTSSARDFWRDKLSQLTLDKRKEKIIRPRFEWIADSTAEYLPQAVHIVDIHTDHSAYVEEMARLKLFTQKTILDPFLRLERNTLDPQINVASGKGGEEMLTGHADVVTLFEVADRTADADHLMATSGRLLKKGGLCFMTTILISGFDLQILWDKAESIFPPDRLNLFSVEGLRSLFERWDFECLEFSTPGLLDIEIVEKAVRRDPTISCSRFAEYLLTCRDEETKMNFQQFLQRNLLSSYGRILLRKK